MLVEGAQVMIADQRLGYDPVETILVTFSTWETYVYIYIYSLVWICMV